MRIKLPGLHVYRPGHRNHQDRNAASEPTFSVGGTDVHLGRRPADPREAVHVEVLDAPADAPRLQGRPAPRDADPWRPLRRPPPAPSAAPRMSPSLTAMFGCEIEVPTVDVEAPEGTPPPQRSTVLVRRPHWNLETDDNGPGKHDLEAVFNPLATQAQVVEATKEIVEMFSVLRRKAMEGSTKVVPLKEIAPDAAGDYTLKVNDLRFGGRLQSTYGIKLQDLDETMQELLPKPQVTKIRRDTQAVADHFAQMNAGAPLPEGARQFVQLINMYLARAQAKRQTDGSVHVNFRMMLRSDFCSAYEKLLGDADRAAMKSLLTTAPGQAVPPFMQALEMTDPQKLVFAQPYRHKDPSKPRVPGPAIKDWLQSIVDGRDQGLFKKDLLSPPAGYPLHTGNLSKDYGMGAMGVDEANGMLLLELRGAPYRPEHVPMNGQIVRAVLNELGHAAALNETLAVTQRGAVESPKFDVLNRAEEAYEGLEVVAGVLATREDTLTQSNWKLLSRGLQAQLAKLPALRESISARANSAWAPRLVQRLDDLMTAGRDMLQAGDPWTSAGEVMAKLPAYRTAVAGFEAALWDAGRTSR